jgi:hypothetical protein
MKGGPTYIYCLSACLETSAYGCCSARTPLLHAVELRLTTQGSGTVFRVRESTFREETRFTTIVMHVAACGVLGELDTVCQYAALRRIATLRKRCNRKRHFAARFLRVREPGFIWK